MSIWRRLVGDRPIVTRLVVAVAGAMTVVLLFAGGFVFWRVEYALNRQLNQDLDAYREVVEAAVATGTTPPSDTPGQSYQIYDRTGRVIGGNTTTRLLDPNTITRAATGTQTYEDVGHLYPPADHPYRVVTARVQTSRGQLVVASAISKNKHDEALRELLLQLSIAGLATLAAASLVGYGTARAALNPVERYRLAAENAGDAPELPVDAGKDDEITRLGHTFNALLDRIAQANNRERQFLADASHELRSPLAVMRTELEVALLRPRGEEETTAAFQSLREQVERLISLSNALLELEELRASDTPAFEPVVVEKLIADVAGRYSAQAADHERRLVTSPAPHLVLDGDQHWLELALGNLVANALRYGQGTITLSATQEGALTRLTVTDEGPGFPTEFLSKAFDRFSRAESSRTSKGTGLGLALVQAVAEAHAGSASITGPSTVTLDLPTHARDRRT
ncbi:MAG: HAMP domain-containing histidine kinase [Nocardioidaceae bacterium]|nr:HAMP domain-containing histidine kinase [Nocardioidaceae bacterium]